MEKVYKIYSLAIPFLTEEINKLNKKAAKYGCEPIEFEILEEKEQVNINGLIDIWYMVKITGKLPKVNDYTLIASLQHKEEGNIVRTAIGETIPEKYRNAPANCDHCNMKRKRIDTFILRKETTGEYKQIGRSCLQEYVGSEEIDARIKYFEFINKIESLLNKTQKEGKSGYTVERDDEIYDLRTYLFYVNEEIKKNGCISRTKAKENNVASTAQKAFNNMIACHTIYVSEDTKKLVEQAIEWAKNLKNTKENISDYHHNICVIANRMKFDYRCIYFAASIIQAYKKECIEKNINEKSNYIGKVGERLTIKLKVVNKSPLVNEFGICNRYVMKDENENIVIWYDNKRRDLEIGEQYNIKATIKGHYERFGEKRTVITRCAVI